MTPTQRTLAIDPGRFCGFAHSDGENGHWDLGSSLRLHTMYDWLTSMHINRGFDILAAEDAQQGSPSFRVQGSHAEYRGVMRMFCEQHGVEFVLVHPTSLKAWLTGSGRAKKSQMVKAVETQFGISCMDHNEADAIAILKYVEAGQHEKTPKVAKRQEKVRKKSERKLFK